jgi:hypothetical protein
MPNIFGIEMLLFEKCAHIHLWVALCQWWHHRTYVELTHYIYIKINNMATFIAILILLGEITSSRYFAHGEHGEKKSKKSIVQFLLP